MIADRRTVAEVLASEKEFHDRRFGDGDARQAQMKYYWAIERGSKRYRDIVVSKASGADVLEYGCGAESLAASLASLARSVTAIDISEEAIRQAQASAQGAAVTYKVMDAMHLEMADASLDLVFGSGIMHHLETAAAAREVARVLRPGGTAVFWEPLGLNPLINAYRWVTPSARTPDEHPLLPRDIAEYRRHFSAVYVEYFGLTTLLSVPIRGWSVAPGARGLLERLDAMLLRIPGLRQLAWYSILRCVK